MPLLWGYDMIVRNVSYLLLGFILGGSLFAVYGSVFALTTTERNDIVSVQESALKFTGTYQPVYDDPYTKVFTYEKLCKGFYTVEDNGTIIKYTGFGDLADEYTYEIDSINIKSDLSTTTKEIIITDPIDTPVLTEPL